MRAVPKTVHTYLIYTVVDVQRLKICCDTSLDIIEFYRRVFRRRADFIELSSHITGFISGFIILTDKEATYIFL